MPRTFAHVRVSTSGQITENQIQEIIASGFHVEPRRIVTEPVSGNLAIARRRGFTRLMDRLESGDVLIVTKLDRLGRDAIDVSTTIKKLAEMDILNAVAQLERDLLIERTQSGLQRAKSEGKVLGRLPALTDAQRRAVRDDISPSLVVSGGYQ